jgi:hypothetical protein
VAFLASHRVVAEPGHRDLDALFGQPVLRVQKLDVLEVAGREQDGLSWRVRHVSGHTRAHDDDARTGRRPGGTGA